MLLIKINNRVIINIYNFKLEKYEKIEYEFNVIIRSADWDFMQ